MINFSFLRRTQIVIVLIISFLFIIKTESVFAIVPNPPTIGHPNNTTASGTSVMLDWNIPSTNVNYFKVQLSTNPGFSPIWGEATTGFSSILANGLPSNGQIFYWHVACGNNDGLGSYSATWSFINTLSLPDVPILNSPADNSNDPSTTILFKWNLVPRADSCYLEIATDVGFMNIFKSCWVEGKYNGIYQYNFLNFGQKYYWHVKAKNSIGESSFSPTSNFTNGSQPNFISLPGSGQGSLVTQNIDVGRNPSDNLYYLFDISRRQNQGSRGQMNDYAGLITRYYNSPLISMQDSDNNWNASNQKSGVDAHAYTSRVYDYLLSTFTLNGFDTVGNSMLSIVEVNNSLAINNAYWDGYKVNFGIAVGYGLLPCSVALDVVAHEWGHAVTEKASKRGVALIYARESGALNEAFSDWIGTAIEHGYGGNTWTMGESTGRIIRDLSDPPSSALPYIYQQPDTYRGSRWDINSDNMAIIPDSTNDWCGVHKNSGVPNKMFYLLSEGGTHPVTGIHVDGIGIDKAIKIAYIANRDYWIKDATFSKACEGMIKVASEDLYGKNSNEEKQVRLAWAAVGIDQRIPVIKINPDIPSYDFGSIVVGKQSPALAITISNDGTKDLTINTINFSSPTSDFYLTNSNISTIPVNGNATFYVKFIPNSINGHNVTLVINSNDPERANIQINLTGNGLAQENKLLERTTITGTNPPYVSNYSYTIGSDVTIDTAANVTIKAGDIIRITPYFHAKEGSYFHAYIGQ